MNEEKVEEEKFGREGFERLQRQAQEYESKLRERLGKFNINDLQRPFPYFSNLFYTFPYFSVRNCTNLAESIRNLQTNQVLNQKSNLKHKEKKLWPKSVQYKKTTKLKQMLTEESKAFEVS